MSKQRGWFHPKWSEDDALWSVAVGRAVKDPANAERAVAESWKITRASVAILVAGLLVLAMAAFANVAVGVMFVGLAFVIIGGGEAMQSARSRLLNRRVIDGATPSSD